MKQPKPRNHVTARIDQMIAEGVKPDEHPVLSIDAIEMLEAIYPERTKRRGEDLEEHAEYAGMVKLVAILRYRAETASGAGEDGTLSQQF